MAARLAPAGGAPLLRVQVANSGAGTASGGHVRAPAARAGARHAAARPPEPPSGAGGGPDGRSRPGRGDLAEYEPAALASGSWTDHLLAAKSASPNRSASRPVRAASRIALHLDLYSLAAALGSGEPPCARNGVLLTDRYVRAAATAWSPARRC